MVYHPWIYPAFKCWSLMEEIHGSQAYVKFAGAPVSVVKKTNPFRTPKGQLPVFCCTDGPLTNFSEVTSFLRKQNYSCDYELSPKQCSEVVAYEHLLKEKLYPAIMYLWWVEPKSYYDVIHGWFFQNIPFPFKLWYPGSFHKKNVDLINSLFDESDNMELVETELHKQAQECLTALSNRLGDKEYFFGKTPSTLDALVFSYLILLLKVDVKVPVLQNHIKACPNLSRYVSKILQRYFPGDLHAAQKRKLKSNLGASKEGVVAQTKDGEFANKGRNFLLSGLVAMTAMFGYALAAGLVQVDLGENQPLEEDYDYDYDDYGDAGPSGE
ncbi:metaxin-1 isoform X2 [Oratosquilla oratoria]|uniref:metaxin-1 isoform X2 n=1 Tax=Oratosquilla oratoria TaxID=337810 RepID=UPI003F77227F